jgi:hypothetical protein
VLVPDGSIPGSNVPLVDFHHNIDNLVTLSPAKLIFIAQKITPSISKLLPPR